MRNWYLAFIALSFSGLSFVLRAQVNTTATYALGDRGTQFSTAAAISTSLESSCGDTLSVTIPAGNVVTSVSVNYAMTAGGAGWMSEQRSYLECVTTGQKEASVTAGVGNSAGTMTYSRTGLTVANGVSATGVLKFYLHPFRTFNTAGGCTTSINKLDNNWSVTVTHIPPPTCLFPSAPQVLNIGPTSATLTWTSGGASQWQIEYGAPGFTPGTGTLLNVPSNPFLLTGLNPNTQYSFIVRDSCAPGDVSIWTNAVGFRTTCLPVLAPFVQNFSGTSWVSGSGFSNGGDAIDACYTRNPGGNPAGGFTGSYFWGIQSATTNTFNTGPSADHTTGTGKYLYVESSLGQVGNSANFVTIPVDLVPLNVPELRFWYHMYGTNIGTLNVEVNGGAGWQNVWSLTGAQQTSEAAPWLEAIVPLPTFADDTVRVRFSTTRLGGFGDIGIDDISLQEAPTCPQPNNFSALSVGAVDANLDWTPGVANFWNVQYGPPGFALGAGTVVTATTHPFVLPGLTPNTDYQVYVRDSCGVGDVSVWVGPISFRTNCLPVSVPYFEPFTSSVWVSGTGTNNAGDAIDPCWRRTPGAQSGFAGAFFWGTKAGAPGTFNTGPSVDHTTATTAGKYIYLESTFGTVGATAEILSPLIDLGSLTQPEVRFWYHMYGFSMGTMELAINNGSGWTNLWSLAGQQQTSAGAPWLEAIVALTAYAGDTVQFRFRGVRNGGQGDGAVDDFRVDSAPTCFSPTAFSAVSVGSTAATLGWTTGGATQWNVSFGAPGVGAGGGAVVSASVNPFTLTGLTPNTAYEAWVRDSCAPGDVSQWTGPVLFTTTCLPFAAPYNQNFDGNLWTAGTGGNNQNDAIDPCWTRSPGTQTGFPSSFFWGTALGITQSFNTGPAVDHTLGTNQGKYIFTEATNAAGTTATITSPQIDLGPLNVPELRFWYHMYGTNIGTLTVEADNGSGWTPVWSLTGQQQTTESAPWLEAVVPMAAFVDDTVRIRFSTNRLGGFGDVSIDDVALLEAPACPQPSGLTVVSTSANSGVLSWTTGGASTWVFSYGAPGFAPGSGVQVPILTNPGTLSGLSPGTTYQVYVKDSCTGGSSAWVGPVTLVTTCIPSIAPYFENFDGSDWVTGTGTNNLNDVINPCWSRNPGAPSGTAGVFFWGTRTGQTPSINTGPSGDHTNGTGQYVYVESTFGASGTTAQLLSPQISLVPLATPELRFWYHMYGGLTGTVSVEANNGSGWISIWTLSGQQQASLTAPWLEAIVPLSAYSGDTVQFRITGTRLGGTGDAAIDDFRVDNAPTCPAPSMLSITAQTDVSVTLAWVSGGSPNALIEYGPPGFAPGTGTFVPATGTSAVVSGLTPATTYEFYVRDSCGLNDVSFAIGPVVATTYSCSNGCLFTLNLTDTFGDGWSGTGAFHRVELVVNGGLPQPFTLPAGNNISYQVYLCQDDPIQLNFFNGGAWVNECGLTLVDPFGTTVYQLSPGGTPPAVLYTDSADCGQNLSCIPPINATVVSVGSNNSTVSWDPLGTPFSQIEYGPTGFALGSGTLIANAVSPQLITGLAPNTAYQFYVRDSCGVGNTSTWTGPISFTTLCAVVSTPYTENFDNGLWTLGTTFGAGTIDPCWNRNQTTPYWWKGNTGVTPSNNTGPSSDHTTGSGSYAYTETVNTPATSTLLTSPLISLVGLTAPELRFWYHMYGAQIGSLTVEVSNDNGASWNNITTLSGQQQTSVNAPWLESVQALSSYVGDTIQIRFVASRLAGANNQVDIAIDDIGVANAPSCPAPTALTTTAISATSIQVGWTTGGATNWQIEYGFPGFAPGTGTLVNATANPFTVTGLSPSASYHFYVRDSCGIGVVSAWAGPVNGSTLCGVATAPFAENFDQDFLEGTGNDNLGSTIDACWFRSDTAGYHWGGGQGTTPTGNTGPPADHTTGFGNYVYAEASFTTPGQSTLLESPSVNLTGLVNPELMFWYHMYGANLGKLMIDVYNGTTWTNGYDSIVGNQGNQWIEYQKILAGFVGQTVKIRLTAFTGTTPTQLGDIAIDDFSLAEGPSCLYPTNLSVTTSTANSVTLAWTTGGASNWQVEYGPVGFVPGTGTLVSAGSNPFVVNGLSASQSYDFYVRDSCGVGNVSQWEGPTQGSTACGTVLTPYFENFESGFDEGTGTNNVGSTINPCWTRTPATGFHWGGGQGTVPTGGTGPTNDHTFGTAAGHYVYAESSGSVTNATAALETPSIDLTPLTYPELRVWVSMNGNTIGKYRMDVFDGTQWDLAVDSVVGDQGNAWFERVVNLSDYDNMTIKVRFISVAGTAPTQFGDIAIDDLLIHDGPSCNEPTALALVGGTDSTLVVGWTSGGASNWQIEYGPTGFAPGTGTLVNASSNPFTISGLMATTTYDVYVRDSCGAGDVSTWLGPISATTLNCASSCSFSLQLTDNFGDGWISTGGNFHQLQIAVNGGAPTNYTLAAGTLQTFPLQFCDGDFVALSFVNAGVWSNECGIQLFDGSGGLLYQRVPGANINTGALYSDTLNCPQLACPDPTALAVVSTGLNNATVSWTPGAGGTSSIQFGPTGFVLGTGILIPNVTSPYSINGLNQNTTYQFYVQTQCGPGNSSTWVGPVSFTTQSCTPPVASFTYTLSGTTISVDGSASTGAFFDWDFGGLGGSFQPTANFAFGAEGTYAITLINSNACGGFDTLTQMVDVCTPIAAGFTHASTFLSTAFDATPSTGVPTSYTWYYGNGATGSGLNPTYAYPNAGTYNVVLAISNACGFTDSITQAVQVCDTIAANFTYTFSGTSFAFDGNISGPDVASYLWYFGDGSTDTVAQPNYTYTVSGNYDVSLVVVNACGYRDSISVPIVVCVKPKAAWTFTVVQSGPGGMDVQFDASTSLGATSYAWYFGDGGTNFTSGYPLHTYPVPGFFWQVTLIVYNQCGDSDTLTSTLASIGTDDPGSGSASVEVYPVPADDVLWMHWISPSASAVRWELYDALGKSCMKGQWDNRDKIEQALDVSHLAPGVYTLELESGSTRTSRRVLIR
ncbi:PKD domain-containing protein [bacterium]|nr:PKD domain-containing protein [bacterium]